MKKLNRHLAVAASLFLALLSPAFIQADEKADAYNYGKEGIEAAKNKQWEKAIDLFQKAVKADPKEANNYNNLGLAYKGAGKMNEAIKAFGDAVAAEPNNSVGYINLGVAYTAEGKYDNAIEDLDKAIKMSPDSISAYRFRAFAYLQKKDYAKAVEDYNVVLKGKQDDDAILDRGAERESTRRARLIADSLPLAEEKSQGLEARGTLRLRRDAEQHPDNSREAPR